MTQKLLFVLPLSLLLTACPPPQNYSPPPQGNEKGFTASGNEPGWRLTMSDDQIDYIGDYGETRFSVAKPEGRPSFNGWRYVTDQITVDITNTPCDDSMADRSYSDTVLLKIGDQTLNGCGGEILPPKQLDNTSWSFAKIAGDTIGTEAPRRQTELQFSNGKLSGTVGCNRFSGSFQVSGNILNTERLISTRMACSGAVGEHERIVLNVLGANPEFGFDWLGHMTLKSGDHIITLKRNY